MILAEFPDHRRRLIFHLLYFEFLHDGVFCIYTGLYLHFQELHTLIRGALMRAFDFFDRRSMRACTAIKYAALR